MGVDFYLCENCGETFPDCGPHTSCEDCGVYLCKDCADEMGLIGCIDEKDCPYCQGKKVTNNDLLNFALEKLSLTCEQLTEELKKRIQDANRI